MKQDLHKLIKVLKKIVGQTCWGIYHKHVNFSFKLGEPLLEIVSYADRTKDRKFRQCTHIRGEWFIWVWEAYWKLTVLDVTGKHQIIASTSSTDRRKTEACALLNGQRIISVDIDHMTGKTRFLFDLGAELLIHHPKGDIKELWRLSDRNDYYLKIFSNGSYTYGPSSGVDRRSKIESVTIREHIALGNKPEKR